MIPPLIALEEHYISEHVDGAVERYNKAFPPEVGRKLASLGDDRIKDLDAGKGHVMNGSAMDTTSR